LGEQVSESKRQIKIGVVGVESGWSSQRLADAVAKRTGTRFLIDLGKVNVDLAREQVIWGDQDLCRMDGLIVKKIDQSYRRELLDRLEILRFLEQRGVPVFSKPGAIGRLLNRLSCTVALRAADIPMPETVVTEDVDVAVEAVRRFERAILKPLFTSKARGMEMVQAGPGTRDAVEAFHAAGHTVIYIQQLVPHAGNDLGVVFLGDEYLASYARVAASTSWNTCTSNGGKYHPCEPSEEVVALARKAQSLCGLDFTCVDIVESDDGPLVFEVSAFGGFRGLLEAHGIEAADLYTDYVLRKLNHG
jgi:ribosomal protein S6--L-glutamate ligase